LIVLAFILVSTSPPEVLFVVFLLYGLSGYVDALLQRIRHKKMPSRLPPCRVAKNR